MENENVIFGKKISIHSEILGEKRPLLIHLPEGYEESQESYPIVVLLNGGYEARFANTAATIQLLSDGGQAPNMIVVGIKDIQHVRDFFPTPVNGRGGEADNFLKFLVEELVPYIESNYRTAPYRILMGASNSGLFTVYSLLIEPDAFNAYLAVSPMLGWNPEFMFEKAEEFFKNDVSVNRILFMSYGDEDYERVVQQVPEFVKLLEVKAPDTLLWKAEIIENDGHVPIPSLYNGLKYIFPSWAFPPSKYLEAGLKGVSTFYENLSEKYGFEVFIPESVYGDLAYELLMKERNDDAINVLKKWIERNPTTPQSHYLLGVAYERSNQKETAIECFERALEKDPTNKDIEKRLTKLKEELDSSDS